MKTEQGESELSIPGWPELLVTQRAPMANYTTWRIGGLADLLVRAALPDQAVAAATWAHQQQLPVTSIGGGSNLLVGDNGVRGLVIVLKTPGERSEALIETTDEGDTVLVKVAAQSPLSWAGRYCSERGWSGLTWGVGLPGQIGGATVNNAGAHGAEMKDHLVGITVFDGSGQPTEQDRAWLDPSYRRTSIKDLPKPRQLVVLAATMRLPKADPNLLMTEADANAAYRKASQPTGRCAGSTFTNPPGDYAGRLLEAAGLKGYSVGGVQFSQKHSNFIVNDGSGTALQVRELIACAQARVRNEFGVELHAEIEEIGEFQGG